MEEPIQNDPMREAHLLSKMREKETEELLAVWQQNDRQAWTDDAFDAIHKVLHERLIDVPEQGLPVTPSSRSPNRARLNTIAAWANSFSWIVLGIAILSFVLRLFFLFGDNASTNLISWILVELSSIAFAGFAFIALQAVTEIIYFLLDGKAGLLQAQ